MSARILIVEDERVTAEDLRDTLTDLGYSVTAAVSSGADAIAQAEENPPDIALMDIRIQGEMDGTAAALVLRERFNIPVIYLTAHADGPTVFARQRCRTAGLHHQAISRSGAARQHRDRAHRHREELKARKKEELLASTLRAISEGVISMDRQGTITLFNPAAEAWTGRSAREALGRTVDEIFQAVAGPSGDKVRKSWEQVLSDGSLQELPAGVDSGVQPRRGAAH